MAADKISENKNTKVTFEEAYKKLEQAADDIISDDITLEEALKSYREGLKYYEICSGILEEAKQLIQMYDKEADTLKEFHEND